MDKFKICPICGEKNPPSFLECDNCGTDLLGVPITEEIQASADQREPENFQGEFARICDCGHANPVTARKCEKCGEDISFVAPVPYKAETPAKWGLKSIDGAISFEIKEGSHTLGREAELSSYLYSKSYVSRNHCLINLQAGELSVENLSQTNHTFVNNNLIDSVVKLSEGDEIGLGGKNINGSRQALAAYFIVERK